MAVKTITPKNWFLTAIGGRYYSSGADPWYVYLPLADVDTTYSLPTGNTWTATNTGSNSAAGTGTGNRTGCGLQYALDNCARNDIIEVTSGATYTGQFTLKYKASGSGKIYIVPTGLASLPAVGSRVVAADATNMAKLTGAAANTATIITENNSSHYRVVGLEITTSSSTASPLQSGVVIIGNSNTSNATMCDDIIFDRCYVHGSADGAHSGRRGFFLDGTNVAAINCRISGFYDDGSDSQAIEIYQGDGPFLIHNNYLEAASENVNFGGIDPTITNSVPQDITITNNYFFKPTAWVGAGHNVKNLLEFKNARRVLVEGNVFENNWADGQSGFSLLLTPRNQNNGAPWCIVNDVTVRLNKFISVDSGINVMGDDNDYSSQRTQRVAIYDNLINLAVPGGAADGDKRAYQIIRGPERVEISNNTVVSTVNNSFLSMNNGPDYFSTPRLVDFRFRNNIVPNGLYGIVGIGTDDTATTLPQNCDDATYTKNVIIAGVSGDQNGAPATDNFVPAVIASVGYTDISGAFSANNYTLTGASAYHNAGTDGADIGCDIAALNAAIAGVV